MGIDGWAKSGSESDAETDAAKGPLESADVQENALANIGSRKKSLNKPKKAAAGKENCPRFEFVDDAKAEALSKKICENAKSLLKTVFYMNGKNFAQEHRDLKLSQFQRFASPLHYVYTENALKNRSGGLTQMRVRTRWSLS